MTHEQKEKIESFIGEGKLREALDLLSASDVGAFRTELLSLKVQLENFERDRLKGLLLKEQEYAVHQQLTDKMIRLSDFLSSGKKGERSAFYNDIQEPTKKTEDMEPASSAMIGTIVGYLAKTLKENKSIKDFFNEFSEATVNWIRPLFIMEEGKKKELLTNLEKNPESKPRQSAVENAMQIALEDDDSNLKYLAEMYEVIKSKEKTGSKQVTNESSIGDNSSNNVVIGGIISGRDTKISINKKFGK